MAKTNILSLTWQTAKKTAVPSVTPTLQGSVKATRHRLERTFGPPTWQASSKGTPLRADTLLEWLVIFSDGTVAHISDSGVCDEERIRNYAVDSVTSHIGFSYVWQVRGTSARAVDLVQAALSSTRRVRTDKDGTMGLVTKTPAHAA